MTDENGRGTELTNGYSVPGLLRLLEALRGGRTTRRKKISKKIGTLPKTR